MRSWAKEADSDYRGYRHRLSREVLRVNIELQLSYAWHVVYVPTKKVSSNICICISRTQAD